MLNWNNLLRFGKIIQGSFKALCIKKLEVDRGFDKYVFQPMIVYEAHRDGKRILVKIPAKSRTLGTETEPEELFEGYSPFDIYKTKNSRNKSFNEYFRVI
jgi:hypothetical protein